MSKKEDYQPFDLLGDPVDPNHNGKGRRTHVVTNEKRRLVVTLCALGKSIEEIAAGLSITPPTLRRHYKKQLIAKEHARIRAEAKVIDSLMRRIDEGSVAAMRTFREVLSDADLKEHAAALASPAPVAAKKGKKETLVDAARRVAGIYAPPPPPSKVN